MGVLCDLCLVVTSPMLKRRWCTAADELDLDCGVLWAPDPTFANHPNSCQADVMCRMKLKMSEHGPSFETWKLDDGSCVGSLVEGGVYISSLPRVL